ncbi:uncharacterized protein LOC107615024 [Arachis ipaensis]|uniref:Uncharacterized protein n=1 Tax=Arachis hypogaea TaxID=3818 RepID=A0A444XEQ7_ARAHY|nr:uncharacterized protein LOC107615024 [Arachis ipaensis]RYQ88195.1 hypothetical protein Ahy_B09g095537 isoform E [Arachis hypogaea]
MLKGRFSLFGASSNSINTNTKNYSSLSKGEELRPKLNLETDRQVYRPGDPVVVTIQISNPSNEYSFLMERLGFEIKGIEKLDTQWFATPKPLPGSKQRRGENVFLDASTPVLVANQIVNFGRSKSCTWRSRFKYIYALQFIFFFASLILLHSSRINPKLLLMIFGT